MSKQDEIIKEVLELYENDFPKHTHETLRLVISTAVLKTQESIMQDALNNMSGMFKGGAK